MTLEQDIRTFVEGLEEDVKNCGLAVQEKTKYGEWNYSDYDRHAMTAEAKLMVNIAKSLRIILGKNMTVGEEL